MSRWDQIGRASVPGGESELRLYRRGDNFAIRLPGYGELMNSRTHGSEDKLGTLTCARFADQPESAVLIGGLGMGFTLGASLSVLPSSARVVVAELVPEVITWNQGDLGACAGYPARDSRVTVRQADVLAVMRESPDAFDAILLDVDNGPEGLTRRDNDRLYSIEGLETAFECLRDNGVLAVWSAGPDRLFPQLLRKTGFAVEEVPVRAHGNKGARHLIWFATRPPRVGD